jgi:hypothetical protein
MKPVFPQDLTAIITIAVMQMTTKASNRAIQGTTNHAPNTVTSLLFTLVDCRGWPQWGQVVADVDISRLQAEQGTRAIDLSQI